jgi:plastocyanin
MHSRSALLFLYVTACTLLAMPRLAEAAAELSVTVSSATGAAVEGAVIIAEPLKGGARLRAGQKAVMDQRNLMFVPEVLIVQTGTAVDFPNSDQVRHQVYSFSGAKKFELALYAGRPQAPVIFDRAGLVTLGCNIHDNMLGYIWVTDSPWYGQSDAGGRLQLHDLAPGEYTVRIWHALLNESGPQLEQRINVPDNQETATSFSLKRPLRAPMHNHGADKKWEDY